MVDGVGHNYVVTDKDRHLVRQQTKTVGLAERRDIGVAVDESPTPATDRARDRGEVGRDLDEAEVAGIGNQPGTSWQGNSLGREPQCGVRQMRRHERTSPPVQRPHGVVRRDELSQQRVERVSMTFAAELSHDVSVRVDHDQRGPRAHGVLLPRGQVGVVQHRMLDVVAFDGRRERRSIGLVLELGGMNPDHHEHVGVLRFERTELVEHVQTVDAAERPEVQQDDLAAQFTHRQCGTAGVQPAATGQIRHSHACRLHGRRPSPSTTTES
jgi:hypothetical protein